MLAELVQIRRRGQHADGQAAAGNHLPQRRAADLRRCRRLAQALRGKRRHRGGAEIAGQRHIRRRSGHGGVQADRADGGRAGPADPDPCGHHVEGLARRRIAVEAGRQARLHRALQARKLRARPAGRARALRRLQVAQRAVVRRSRRQARLRRPHHLSAAGGTLRPPRRAHHWRSRRRVIAPVRLL